MSEVKSILEPQRRKEFWQKFEALLGEYPELLDILDFELEDVEGTIEEKDEPYDKTSPKLHGGMVVILNPRNLQGYETLLVVDPPQQSVFLTDGMLFRAPHEST